MRQGRFWSFLFTLGTLAVCFGLNLLVERLWKAESLVPMIFVLGVFVISLKTQGYFWGVAASFVSVLAVNYAFTYPFYALDLLTPETLAAAVVMFIVSLVTCSLTAKLKQQEKLKAESERERMRANLLRAVSHDLRTPLTSIYGASATVVENYDSLSRQQHLKLLTGVCEDAQWMVRMVENLLSVTRLDGQKVKLAKSPTVLEELVDAVLLKFQKRCPNQKVQVEIPEAFVIIPMDAMLIEQVLLNILENAVDHARGMTELSLTVQCSDGKARFCIRDNGCGIQSERLKNLFRGYTECTEEPADARRSHMGIGLSVCAAIVKAHGGQLQAANRSEGGVQFYFELEMEEADE